MPHQVPRSNKLEIARSLCDRFYRDESGQDLIEYALLAAFVASTSVAGSKGLAGAVANEFTGIGTAVGNAVPSAPSSGGSGSTGGNGGGFSGDGGGDHGGHHRG